MVHQGVMGQTPGLAMAAILSVKFQDRDSFLVLHHLPSSRMLLSLSLSLSTSLSLTLSAPHSASLTLGMNTSLKIKTLGLIKSLWTPEPQTAGHNHSHLSYFSSRGH